MLSPSPAELLAGVADALDQTVLGTLERGVARNQVQAAIGIVRRCAAAVAVHGPVLHADCVDLAASLRALRDADPAAVADGPALDATLADADRVLGSTYPSVTELTVLDLALRAALADVASGIAHTGSPQAGALTALFERMLAREEELGLSPW